MKHVEALKYCCYYMQYEEDVNFHFFPISQSPEKSGLTVKGEEKSQETDYLSLFMY